MDQGNVREDLPRSPGPFTTAEMRCLTKLTIVTLWMVSILESAAESPLVQGGNPLNVVITADFAATADYPLSKTKFGVYNSGLVPLSHYERDSALFDEIKPNSLRIDLW